MQQWLTHFWLNENMELQVILTYLDIKFKRTQNVLHSNLSRTGQEGRHIHIFYSTHW